MIQGILETSLYTRDLDAAAAFYGGVLGLELIARMPGRHIFYRCGDAVLLVFNPDHTSREQTTVNDAPIPLHGACGEGHVAFRVAEQQLDAFREHLVGHGVAIESDVRWPHGGRSFYVRDPAGNSVEFATEQLWAAAENKVQRATCGSGRAVSPIFAPGLQQLLVRANMLRGNAHGPEAGSLEETLETLFRPSQRLAVYGSLAPGRPNHHVIEDVGGSWTRGFVEGELFEIGWGAAIGYPAMRWVPGRGRIPVDVLLSERLPGAWARLDEFEGPDYRRVLIPVFGDGGRLAVANIYEARHERRR